MLHIWTVQLEKGKGTIYNINLLGLFYIKVTLWAH